MGGRDFCCILGCSNRRCDQPKQSKLSFHKIPLKPQNRRSAWIKAAGRAEHGKNKFNVTEYTRICGAHFVKGKKNNQQTDIDYVPTVNLPPPTLKLTPMKVRTSKTSSSASAFSDAIKEGNDRKIKKINKKTGRLEGGLDLNDVQEEVVIKTSGTEEQDTITLDEVYLSLLF